MIDQSGPLPPINKILDEAAAGDGALKAHGHSQARLIEKTLAEFDLVAEVRNIHYGPRLTQFSLKPDSDVPISKIKRLETDLAVALSGALVDIQEPLPTYPYVTVVVENYRQPQVKLRQVIESAAFQQKEGALKVGLGLDAFGQPVVIDLAAMPHLLIGGATGSGKSVCVNAIIASLLCTYPPAALQLLLIDPAAVELKIYHDLPHLVAPVITETDWVLDALTGVVQAIDRRYRRFAQLQVRDIAAYNQKAPQAGQQPMPYLVIIIDNLVDLMIDAPKDLEQVLTRIAQKARGAGIHLILATLRTNVTTLAGSIKANFPGRIAFRVVDKAESQLILDMAGAEKLLGQGDMLYKSPAAGRLQRLQGVYVAEAELKRIVDFWHHPS